MVLSVGYHKKGYPKQEPKMSLKPCKNQSQKTTVRSLQNSPIRSRPCAEALSPRPRPKRLRMGCQFSDSLEAGLGKHTRNLRPDQTPLTKRHVQINAPNYSRKRQPHSGTVRAERPTGQGTGRNRGYLPLCSSLCYLTPVPRTKQHGRSSPCPCSLRNRRRAQLLVLRLVRDPPVGS